MRKATRSRIESSASPTIPSVDLRSQLIRDEGTGPVVSGRFKPYRDTVEKLTIGYGRNLDDSGLRRSEVEFMLDNDIEEKAAQLAEKLPWTANLDEARRGVLVNMAFNLGVERLLKFTNTLAAIERHDWLAAAAGMLASKWASQVGDRATRLAEQMRRGDWG